MKKYVSIMCILSIILVLIVSLASCSSGKKVATSATSTTSKTTLTTSTSKTTTTTTMPGQTVGDILGRVAGISSVQFDEVDTVLMNPQITQKVHIKKNKMRAEINLQGQTLVMLIDNDTQTIYQYMPAQNMAQQQTYIPNNYLGGIQHILTYNPTTVGTETMDGKVCTVIQYTNDKGQTEKAWLWQDYGLPIRTEMTTAQGTSIFELKNIQLGDIADGMFELPAGVKIVQQTTTQTNP